MLDSAVSTQLMLYATVMIVTWLLEKFVRGETTWVKWRHSMGNGIFIASALPIQLPMMALCAAVSTWTAAHHFGLVHLFAGAESPWLKYGVMFVALDLLDWVYHFIMHRIAAFWRFHLLHHTDRVVDVSTTVREHPGETILRNGFLILWVLLCGASVEVLMLRQTVETVANILAHTSFRLAPRPARLVGWLFITPNLHHAHHHLRLPATNCNYGDVFSVWDRLFGTFIDMPGEDIVFGLDTHMAGAPAAFPLLRRLRTRLNRRFVPVGALPAPARPGGRG